MWIVAVPITDPSSQAAGFASKLLASHAFWIVVSLDGSAFGIVRNTFAIPACPRPAEVASTLKPVPLFLLPCPATLAVSFGLNGSVAQLDAWNGLEIGDDIFGAGCGAGELHRRAVGGVDGEVRTVGDRDDLTDIRRDALHELRQRSLVTVTCAVWGSTVILARVMIVPRLNGPAIACVTIVAPNGAPSYGPVR